MMARITVWISIVFFTVSRTHSVSTKGTDAICYKGNSSLETRTSTYRELHEVGFWVWRRTVFHTKYITENYTKTEPTCCSGYEEKTQNCACDYAWGGDSCDKPLVCFVGQPNPDNYSSAIRQVLFLNGMKYKTNNPQSASEGLPEQCRPKCLKQINNGSIETTESENATYYLIPIDSPCNTITNENIFWDFVKSRKYMIATGIGILLFTTVVCIACNVLRKRVSQDAEENIPMQSKYPEYMEDNVIYS